MGNCLIAQSGGPTSVINGSLAGVIRANQLNHKFDRVLGGIHGIEGVLQNKLFDLTDLPAEEVALLRQTPSSALGTCRYKLKRDQEQDFETLNSVLKENNVDVMFYVGGNDSMDTVDALSEWAASHGSKTRFVGIPKTVDNDLVPPDHCPGFPSAAKFANLVTKATAFDYDAYTRPEVFVLETMGRDAGWLAASACMSGVVDLLVLPEIAYDKDAFLERVQKTMEEKGSCYIVTSEGARDAEGNYVSAGESANDGFAHAVLGGAGLAIKQQIVDAGIAPRGVVQDLSRAARSSNFAMSKVDYCEAYELGLSAHMHACDDTFTAKVVGVKRGQANGGYNPEIFVDDASKFANFVKSFPQEWAKPDYAGITDEAKDYFAPLIKGEPKLEWGDDGLLKMVKPFNLR